MNNKNSENNSSFENPEHTPSEESSKDISSTDASEDTSTLNISEDTSSTKTPKDTSSTSSTICDNLNSCSAAINSCISAPLSTLNNINSLKTALCDLPLNPCEQKFIANNISPLLSVADLLGRLSNNLSYSVNILTNSPIKKPKRHKLEDTISTIYRINDQCKDLYDVIEERVDILLKGKC